MMMDMPAPPVSFMDAIRCAIAERGWAMVNGRDGRFYTLGMSLRSDHPELFLANTTESDAYATFESITQHAKQGRPVSSGLQRISGRTLYLARVSSKFLSIRMPAIRAYYGGDRPVLQIVPANAQGFLPWESQGDGGLNQLLFTPPTGCVQ